MLLWLWCRLATAALIRPLGWEIPYATGIAVKRKKKRKEKALVYCKNIKYVNISLPSGTINQTSYWLRSNDATVSISCAPGDGTVSPSSACLVFLPLALSVSDLVVTIFKGTSAIVLSAVSSVPS